MRAHTPRVEIAIGPGSGSKAAVTVIYVNVKGERITTDGRPFNSFVDAQKWADERDDYYKSNGTKTEVYYLG